MQEDIFPAAEKILWDIENVLKKDPNLLGFEIILALDNENKSPVLHAENSLGLASWSVKPLYRYAYTRLLELRQNKHKREDPSTVSRWLLGALLLNPDVSTFWNMRRELVKNGRLEPTSELHFVAVVLYYKAKCFEAFAYRRWLLQLILLGNTRTVNVEALLQNEIKVVTMSADRYANNYYAWSHREHIVATFEEVSPSTLDSFLKVEWEDSEKWSSLHISDYSGFAYRQFLLKRLLRYRESQAPPELETKCREVVLKFVRAAKLNNESLLLKSSCNEVLDLLHDASDQKHTDDINYGWTLIGLSYWMDECMSNEELLNLYPGHEALWYHRRFLAHILVVLISSYKKYSFYKIEIFSVRQKCGSHDDASNKRDECLQQTPLGIVFHKRNLELIEIAKSIGGHQNIMAERFLKFLAGLSLEQ